VSDELLALTTLAEPYKCASSSRAWARLVAAKGTLFCLFQQEQKSPHEAGLKYQIFD
jgi:hypothetical protein